MSKQYITIKNVKYYLTNALKGSLVLFFSKEGARVVRTRKQAEKLGIDLSKLKEDKPTKTPKPRAEIKVKVSKNSNLDVSKLESKARLTLESKELESKLPLSKEHLLNIRVPFQVMKALPSHDKIAYHNLKIKEVDEVSEIYKLIMYCYNNRAFLKKISYPYLESVILHNEVEEEAFIFEDLKPHLDKYLQVYKDTYLIEYEYLEDIASALPRNSLYIGWVLKAITLHIFHRDFIGVLPLPRVDGVPMKLEV